MAQAAPLATKQVLVSYSAQQPFLSSPNWKHLHNALLVQLPLHNIHWKSASRTSIRTIQELDITLVQLDKLRDEHTSQIPVTLLDKPLLHIYIVTCEASFRVCSISRQYPAYRLTGQRG